MHEAYWGLSQPPFQNVPDPGFFCPLPAHTDVLEKLLYVVQYSKGGALLTGEAGCGKSTLSRVFLLQLEEEKYDVGLVINPSVPARELLDEVAYQLGVTLSASERSAQFRSLNDHLVANAQAAKGTVLMIDEAHTIKDEAVFEDLRMLLNFQFNDRQLLSLILLGLPELREVITRQRSFDQRLAVRLKLGPLSEAETTFYIDFRLEKARGKKGLFTKEAVKAIHRIAEGIPRNINNICDLCLLEGSKRKAKGIDAALVKVVQEFI